MRLEGCGPGRRRVPAALVRDAALRAAPHHEAGGRTKSEMGQNRPAAPHQTARVFNHLVGDGEHACLTKVSKAADVSSEGRGSGWGACWLADETHDLQPMISHRRFDFPH
jgi:hypothetical protein